MIERGMATDVTMASMGIENLNTIFAGASQRGNFSKSLTKGLMDIAAAGQPLEQAAKWLGEVVGILTDPKANWSEVRKAFEGMGKMGEETWKKLAGRGINSIAKLQSAIRTGLRFTQAHGPRKLTLIHFSYIHLFQRVRTIGLNQIRGSGSQSKKHTQSKICSVHCLIDN